VGAFTDKEGFSELILFLLLNTLAEGSFPGSQRLELDLVLGPAVPIAWSIICKIYK